MNRTAMIALVCLTAYGLLDFAVFALVAIAWRTRAVAPSNLPPVVRARRIFLLRITPFVTAATITLLIVAPAFELYEPVRDDERFGPIVAMLAGIAILSVSIAVVRAVISVWITRRVEREWLRSAQALDAAAGLRAFIVDGTSPVLALVGVFSPTLIAARSIIETCTAEEIAAIVAHERGHFTARDNLKRWVMASLPDAPLATRLHHDMMEAWHHAAEDAADDAATQGEPQARADLAALLLKVVRLASDPIWNAAVVSPFVERDGLERRVRRLLQPELEPPAPVAIIPVACLAVIVAASVMIVSSPAMLRVIFDAFENLVAFGR